MKSTSVIASILAVPSIFKVSSQPINDKLAGLSISHLLTKDMYYFYEPIVIEDLKINHAAGTVTVNGKYEITNKPGEGVTGEGYYADEETALAVTIKLNEIEWERHVNRMDELKKMSSFLEEAIKADAEAAKRMKK